MRTEPHRLVFIDETGTNTKMTRARGRCDRRERLRSKAPFGHWKTPTFVAALRNDRIDRAVGHRRADRPGDLRDLRRTQLVPTLQPGDIVMLDNLGSHKGKCAAEQRFATAARVSCFCRPTRPT